MPNVNKLHHMEDYSTSILHFLSSTKVIQIRRLAENTDEPTHCLTGRLFPYAMITALMFTSGDAVYQHAVKCISFSKAVYPFLFLPWCWA